jgi:hypothetical protein
MTPATGAATPIDPTQLSRTVHVGVDPAFAGSQGAATRRWRVSSGTHRPGVNPEVTAVGRVWAPRWPSTSSSTQAAREVLTSAGSGEHPGGWCAGGTSDVSRRLVAHLSHWAGSLMCHSGVRVARASLAPVVPLACGVQVTTAPFGCCGSPVCRLTG